MAQQPNIELRDSDLPRPEAGPNPERRWTPDRPGDIAGTGVPWGGAFGTPGPDAGYAIKLAAGRELNLTDHERRADANVALAAVAAARASLASRGPTMVDVDAAIVILGYDTDSELGAVRAAAIAGAAHHPQRIRRIVAGIPIDVIEDSADDLRTRVAAGESLIEI